MSVTVNKLDYIYKKLLHDVKLKMNDTIEISNEEYGTIYECDGPIVDPSEEYNHDYSKDYLTIISLEDNNIISWRCNYTSWTKTISVSIDNGITWKNYTSSKSYINEQISGTQLAILNKNDKMLIKGNTCEFYGHFYGTGSHSYYDAYNYFASSNKFILEGNIFSLMNGDNINDDIHYQADNRFAYLFKDCSYLISAQNLILPLKTTPGYHSDDLRYYAYLFKNCTSLIIPPKLESNVLRQCYVGMFQGCTSLLKAPELPAKILKESCYNLMFEGCTSLTNAPQLPALTLAQYCYCDMFKNCISLTKTPELPATTLDIDCYKGMFMNCTSLTSAPELPATTLISCCYQSMFQSCTSLNYIKMLVSNIPLNSCLTNWLNNVSNSGTFVKLQGVEFPIGDSGIPQGWTVQELDPDTGEIVNEYIAE